MILILIEKVTTKIRKSAAEIMKSSQVKKFKRALGEKSFTLDFKNSTLSKKKNGASLTSEVVSLILKNELAFKSIA